MLILSEINNHIMLMLKSTQDWLLNLVSIFLCSLTDHRWLMFYLIILLTILLNVYKKKDGRDSVVNKEQNDGNEKVTDYEEEGGDEDNEDENTDGNNNNNDDVETNKNCRCK